MGVGFIEIVLIAIALAMDAFAISMSTGIALLYIKPWNAIKIGLFFGIAQAVMPVLGWFSGSAFNKYIVSFDHWIAFILLMALGIKMFIEACKGDDKVEKKDPVSTAVLFVMAIATSIDAFAVGISFSLITDKIIIAAIIIGCITFVLSFIGVYIGRKVGKIMQKRAEIFGALILCGIGIKILIEGLTK